MNSKIHILLYLLMALALPSFAYDNFHDEATQELNETNIWVSTEFKKDETMATTTFRAWLPFNPDDCWKIMTDTNNYVVYSKDYKDTRTLDKNQFDLVDSKKPENIDSFYALVGSEKFPSDYGRQKGKNWVSYVLLRFNLPWPLADRWAVVKINNNESKATAGEYEYSYKISSGNFKDLKGWWQLLAIPGKLGWTEFRGEYKADPGISIPQFLAKKIFKASMKQTIETYNNALEKNGAKKAN